MMTFLAIVGAITILALSVLGVVVLGVTISARADLRDMGPESWNYEMTSQETDLETWKEQQW